MHGMTKTWIKNPNELLSIAHMLKMTIANPTNAFGLEGERRGGTGTHSAYLSVYILGYLIWPTRGWLYQMSTKQGRTRCTLTSLWSLHKLIWVHQALLSWFASYTRGPRFESHPSNSILLTFYIAVIPRHLDISQRLTEFKNCFIAKWQVLLKF